jgi:hypothetical protein
MIQMLLYRDATIRLPLRDIADLLNSVAKHCRASVGEELVEMDGQTISLASYKRLPAHFLKEAGKADIAIVATAKRYDNNYFYEYELNERNVVIVSFSGWDQLTKLPVSNGFVMMLTEMLVDQIRLGSSHRVSRGCVNDFRAMKTDIDFGLRAAFVCEDCIEQFNRSNPDISRRAIFEDIRLLLNEVSDASRKHMELTEHWRMKSPQHNQTETSYDVFLCHNSNEKPEVRALNQGLRNNGIRTWFDEEELRPGQPWQPELERQIQNVRCAAVVVGSSGLGPWHDFEIRAFLSEFANRGCPIIPVLLETSGTVPDLPLFLKQFTWVDFRKKTPDPWPRLLWGIRGRAQ